MKKLISSKINFIIQKSLVYINITIVALWFILFLSEGGTENLLNQTVLKQVLMILGILGMFASSFIGFLYPRISFASITVIFIVFDSFAVINLPFFSQHIFTHAMVIFANLFILYYYYEIMVKSKNKEFEELNESFIQLKQSHEITKAMMDITPKMLLNENIDQILQHILEVAIKLIPNAQSGSILIRNGDIMDFKAASGYNLEILKNIHLRYKDTYQYRLGELFEPTVIKDVKTFNEANVDRRLADEFSESNVEMAQAVLTCSIRLHDHIYGFINLDNMENENAFTEQDKVLTKHLASQIEIALNNHMLVEEIYKLSRYDALTGAYSRKYFQNYINQLKHQNNQVFSLAVFDVNDLKGINDSYGHHMGDQYLLHFVNIIKSVISKSDNLFRTGGDEFILVMMDKDCDQAKLLMAEIKKQSINQPFSTSKDHRMIQYSAGFACYPDDSSSFDEIIEIADMNMYKNKELEKSKHKI